MHTTGALILSAEARAKTAEARIAELEAENARLREALEFYLRPQSLHLTGDDGPARS